MGLHQLLVLFKGKPQKSAIGDRLKEVPGRGLGKKRFGNPAEGRRICKRDDMLFILIEVIRFLDPFLH